MTNSQNFFSMAAPGDGPAAVVLRGNPEVAVLLAPRADGRAWAVDDEVNLGNHNNVVVTAVTADGEAVAWNCLKIALALSRARRARREGSTPGPGDGR